MISLRIWNRRLHRSEPEGQRFLRQTEHMRGSSRIYKRAGGQGADEIQKGYCELHIVGAVRADGVRGAYPADQDDKSDFPAGRNLMVSSRGGRLRPVFVCRLFSSDPADLPKKRRKRLPGKRKPAGRERDGRERSAKRCMSLRCSFFLWRFGWEAWRKRSPRYPEACRGRRYPRSFPLLP